MRTMHVAILLVSSAIAGPIIAWAKPVGLVGGHALDLRPLAVVAQLPRYSASGTHTCDSGRSCVVSGLFSNCNDAQSSLHIRDCCAARGGKSKNFALNYCIPDVSGR
jgi:hypothetical protein